MKVLLADVLTRLAHELRATAYASAALEAVVQDALIVQLACDLPSRSQSIQHMDLLTQTLADFARFTEMIVVQVPDHTVNLEDALAVLHLRDLRQSLAGQCDHSTCDSGHVDVF